MQESEKIINTFDKKAKSIYESMDNSMGEDLEALYDIYSENDYCYSDMLKFYNKAVLLSQEIIKEFITIIMADLRGGMQDGLGYGYIWKNTMRMKHIKMLIISIVIRLNELSINEKEI